MSRWRPASGTGGQASIMRLTKAEIERAWRQRGAGRRTLRDDQVKGLALIVNAESGSWVYSYKPGGHDAKARRCPTRHLRFGGLDPVDLEAARRLAAAAKLKASSGGDPAREQAVELAQEIERR